MMEQKVGDAHMLAAGTNRRNYQMDNLKCLLIFSVVFGHMLELFMGKNSPERVIYLVIYSFHMPLFAFVSGVFARYNPSKIKNNMIYPYLIFQTLYLLFSNQILDKDADMQYTTPYWLLWYLFAIIVWNLVLPLVQVEGMKKKWPCCSRRPLPAYSSVLMRKPVISCPHPGSWSSSPTSF